MSKPQLAILDDIYGLLYDQADLELMEDPIFVPAVNHIYSKKTYDRLFKEQEDDFKLIERMQSLKNRLIDMSQNRIPHNRKEEEELNVQVLQLSAEVGQAEVRLSYGKANQKIRGVVHDPNLTILRKEMITQDASVIGSIATAAAYRLISETPNIHIHASKEQGKRIDEFLEFYKMDSRSNKLLADPGKKADHIAISAKRAKLQADILLLNKFLNNDASLNLAGQAAILIKLKISDQLRPKADNKANGVDQKSAADIKPVVPSRANLAVQAFVPNPMVALDRMNPLSPNRALSPAIPANPNAANAAVQAEMAKRISDEEHRKKAEDNAKAKLAQQRAAEEKALADAMAASLAQQKVDEKRKADRKAAEQAAKRVDEEVEDAFAAIALADKKEAEEKARREAEDKAMAEAFAASLAQENADRIRRERLIANQLAAANAANVNANANANANRVIVYQQPQLAPVNPPVAADPTPTSSGKAAAAKIKWKG